MSELLIELFSEEIPARMQARAASDLAQAVLAALETEGLGAGLAKDGGQKGQSTAAEARLKTVSCSTPRRLVLVVDGLPAQSPTVVDERKGPRVGAPDAAIQGFLKGAGIASIGDARVVEDKKGSYYVATIEKKGRPTAEIIAAIMPAVLSKFSW
ncbi:MAG TPA: glycine--tRNA ligase subunit beta, partial [Hyphomicrobiaceae bacterium]|nr:glycine--tRNA ligase subunit beta [Hyphomicrobiaceae bacterium]